MGTAFADMRFILKFSLDLEADIPNFRTVSLRQPLRR